MELGSRTEPYDRYSMSRTFEEVFDVKPMAQGDREASVVRGIWKQFAIAAGSRARERAASRWLGFL
jgi:hypothetical protein